MGGKFKIKKQQPIASPVGRTPAKVVFGFLNSKTLVIRMARKTASSS